VTLQEAVPQFSSKKNQIASMVKQKAPPAKPATTTAVVGGKRGRDAKERKCDEKKEDEMKSFCTEDFAVPSYAFKTSCLSTLKSLYDKANNLTERQFGPLRTLVIQDLDAESIWEELQTRNRPVLRFIKKLKKKFKKEGNRGEEEEEELEKGIEGEEEGEEEGDETEEGDGYGERDDDVEGDDEEDDFL